MRAVALRYAPLLLLAALWEAAPRLGLVDAETLPPLSAVARALVGLAADGSLALNGWSSLRNLAAGLGLGIAVGAALGLTMAWYRPMEIVFNPLVRILYPLPRSALIPVMILWFGLGAKSKIAAVFLGSLLPVVLGAFNGARGVEPVLIWSALAAGTSRRAALWEVVLPAAMPEILAGIRNALALSFILLVASEFLIGQRGMGYLISFLGEGGNYDGMFAGVLVVSLVGFLADRLYLGLMGWALRWRE
ncbi:MAG TPA: ABC transporter permease [Stellaceae bacterium]|nr:ABC transporter permease [Stellaceae bacterium]